MTTANETATTARKVWVIHPTQSGLDEIAACGVMCGTAGAQRFDTIMRTYGYDVAIRSSSGRETFDAFYPGHAIYWTPASAIARI